MSLFNITVNNSVTMHANLAAYDSSSEGFIIASIFDFKTTLKAVQKELKKKSTIRLYYTSAVVNPRDIIIETASVPDSDYTHMIIYRKDVCENMKNGPRITFFTFQIMDVTSPWDFYAKIFPEEFKQIVYDKLYDLSPAPILKEWTDYIINYLIDSGYMREANGMISDDDKRFRVTVTAVDVENLIFQIKEGLSRGRIFMPGQTSEFMSEIRGIDAYLHTFTDILTKKIQESFRPLFVPQQDSYSKDLQIVSDYMKWSDGISLYPAQKDIAQAVANALSRQKCCFIVGEMGVKIPAPAYSNISHSFR